MNKARYRVDSRLIHGQVIARWAIKDSIKRIIIVDDDLAADEFMKDIYMMAAPQGISVDVFTVNEAFENYKANQITDQNTLVLFKDIDSVLRLSRLGYQIEELQIGGLPSGPGKKLVYKTIALAPQDYTALDEIAKEGTKTYFQMLPEEDPMPYERVKR
jgi:D-glucosaminate-specific PTS system IIB component